MIQGPNMRVLLDGLELKNAGLTLASALDAAREGAHGRMLVEVVADGKPVPPTDIDHPPAAAPYADQLEFTSADGPAMVRFAALEAADLLEQLPALHARAAGQIQSGDVHSALETIKQVFQAWGHAHGAVRLISSAKSAAANPELAESMTELAQRLNEVKRALTQQDWAGVGDALAYDLDAPAARWREWLLAAAGQAA